MLRIFTQARSFDKALLARTLPPGSFRKILLKPNWVLHATREEFPITALITSAALIKAVLDACLDAYPSAESIIVGDVPLQSCEFEKMLAQSGLDLLREEYAKSCGGKVRFLDLRRERYVSRDGFLELESDAMGDPAGYSEVILDERSLLEEVSHRSDRFRVSDYDPVETTSVHRPGSHRYLIARSVLEADLVINLPKMKTHQKSGVTGALKNLVGINGSKAYLVHHQIGKPSKGGDEFPEDADPLLVCQVRLRELLQKRSPWLFKLAKYGWELVKRFRGIKTVATKENIESGGLYVGAGSWYGNDSIWRMVYDLNLILLFGKAEGGKLAAEPQRRVISIMDGIVAGEGNGPLQPIPVKAGIVMVSENPFLVDFAMAKMMGFDWRKIRLLANHRRFGWAGFADFDPEAFEVEIDGKVVREGVLAIPVLQCFVPPPGWKGHMEIAPESSDAVD